MNILKRIRHIWELSAYEPAHPSDGKKYPEYPAGTEVSMIVKKPEKMKDVFIPRTTRDPIKELVTEQSNEN